MCIWKTNRLSVNIIEIIKIENLSIIRVEVFMFNKIFSTLFDSGNPIKATIILCGTEQWGTTQLNTVRLAVYI